MKTIETIYKGYRMRSRLEARWAVFFDALGIQWEYEKEGYILENGEWYLPDFWLPELDCWIEIKGQCPTSEENDKARFLALGTQKVTFIFWGDLQPFWYEAIPLRTMEESKRLFEQTEEYYPITELKYHGMLGHRFSYRDGEVYFSDTFWGFHECTSCRKIVFDMSVHLSSSKPCECAPHAVLQHNTPHLIAAYTAARQARFEHGESPR